jgi:hypothetical protein
MLELTRFDGEEYTSLGKYTTLQTALDAAGQLHPFVVVDADCALLMSGKDETGETFDAYEPHGWEQARDVRAEMRADDEEYQRQVRDERAILAGMGGGVRAYNEAMGYDSYTPEPCGQHCQDCPRCGY